MEHVIIIGAGCAGYRNAADDLLKIRRELRNLQFAGSQSATALQAR
jgi:hypothetical protein